jgi:uncharacterized protein (DUF1697 family)
MLIGDGGDDAEISQAAGGGKMKTYIALFRGINVGGNNILPMKELVTVLESIGLRNIKTYIQSGNAVLQSAEKNTATLALKISRTIKQSHGLEPKVWLIDAAVFRKAILANPYSEAESEPNTLHLNFLASIPASPDWNALEKLKSATERFKLIGDVLYLHAPDRMGKSKLYASLEKKLGVAMTTRNWRTVCKLMELAGEDN